MGEQGREIQGEMEGPQALAWFFYIVILIGGILAFTSPFASADYSKDRSFGAEGQAMIQLGEANRSATVPSQALARDARGRLVIGAANSDFWLVSRYRIDGSLDTTFGDDGQVVVDRWGGYSTDWEGAANLTDLVVRPDGRIILVGFLGGIDRVHEPPTIALQQLLPDGRPDNSFGTTLGGRTFGDDVGAASIALGHRGKLLVSGFSLGARSGRDINGVLFRFNADGSLDKTFAAGGRLYIRGTGDLGRAKSKSSYLLDVRILPGGKIVAGGAFKGKYLVIRLTESGKLDRTFGSGGRSIVEVAAKGCACELGRAIAVDPRGRILLTGHVAPRDSSKPEYGATIRLTRSGELDRSFGKAGVARFFKGRTTRFYDIAVDRRSGTWVTGRSGNSRGSARMLTARYLPSGDPDSQFFKQGWFDGPGPVGAGWKLLPAGRSMYLMTKREKSKRESLSVFKFSWGG